MYLFTLSYSLGLLNLYKVSEPSVISDIISSAFEFSKYFG